MSPGPAKKGPRLNPRFCRYYEKIEPIYERQSPYKQCEGHPVHDGLCFGHWAKTYSTLKERFARDKDEDGQK